MKAHKDNLADQDLQDKEEMLALQVVLEKPGPR